MLSLFGSTRSDVQKGQGGAAAPPKNLPVNVEEQGKWSGEKM
jgi:hypothetical protein